MTRLFSFVCLLSFNGIPSSAQTVNIRPFRTIDLSAAVKTYTGREDFALRPLAQANKRWVVTAGFKSTKQSIVLMGDDTDEVRFSPILQGLADGVGVDNEAQIFVRYAMTSWGITEVDALDSDFQRVTRRRIAGAGWAPIFSGSEVLWRQGSSLSRLPALLVGPTSLQSTERLDPALSAPRWKPPELAAERQFMFPLPPLGRSSNKWMRFGCLSEEIEIIENDGSLVSKVSAQLDHAYRRGNLPIEKRDLINGKSRVIWAVGSREGELMVCLSGLPLAGPAYIGVFDPVTGALNRLIAAELPVSPGRVSKHNPTGIIYPVSAALDDRLVVLDVIGVLALYY